MENQVLEKAPETKSNVEQPVASPAPAAGTNWLPGFGLIALGALFLAGQFIDLGNFALSVGFVGVGAVFAIVYLSNRNQWWALIPSYVFAVIGVFLLVEPMLGGNGDAIYWVTAIGLPFLVVFFTNPQQRWWALIPTYVMGSVALFLFLDNILGPNGDAIYWVGMVGLPFFGLFITNPKERWWALIPAYVMTTVAGFLFVEPLLNRVSGEMVGAFWLFAIAAPFFVVYVTNPKERWWALIPGGILTVIGIGLTIASAEWFVPAILILGGGFLLLKQGLGNKQAEPAQPTLTGPDADKPMV